MKRIDINPKDYPRGSVRRKAAQVIQEQLESEINELIDATSDQSSHLASLTKRVQALEGNPREPPATGLPADVFSKSQLISFAQAFFPDELVSYADDLRPFCRKLRDVLVVHYPFIERINNQQERFGYSAPDEKHSDADHRVDTDEIIDFMINSDSPGIPLERINYSVNPLTPW